MKIKQLKLLKLVKMVFMEIMLFFLHVYNKSDDDGFEYKMVFLIWLLIVNE